MAVSEAQKKSAGKWDKANMSVLACKIKKEDADRFKLYCSVNGVTVNNELKGHVMRCIGEEAVSEATEAPKGIQGYSLSPESMKKAQRASEAKGETTTAFLERAIDSQVILDERAKGLAAQIAALNKPLEITTAETKKEEE